MSATVYVFQSKLSPHKIRCCDRETAQGLIDSRDWSHTGTLNAAAWIEHLMNDVEDRGRQIHSLEKWRLK